MIANNTHIKKTKGEPKLLTQIKVKMPTGGYSPKTIQAYIKWIKAFIIYNGKYHLFEMEKENVERFLTHLAVNRDVSASTQNQELSTEKYYKIKLNNEMKPALNTHRSKHESVSHDKILSVNEFQIRIISNFFTHF